MNFGITCTSSIICIASLRLQGRTSKRAATAMTTDSAALQRGVNTLFGVNQVCHLTWTCCQSAAVGTRQGSGLLQEDATASIVGTEGHSLLRALSLSLYLLFPSDEGKLGIEAIGSKQLHRGIKLLKQKPVVPGFGDMPMSLLFILHELSPFLVAQGEPEFCYTTSCNGLCNQHMPIACALVLRASTDLHVQSLQTLAICVYMLQYIGAFPGCPSLSKLLVCVHTMHTCCKTTLVKECVSLVGDTLYSAALI